MALIEQKPNTLLQWPDFMSRFEAPMPELMRAMEESQYYPPEIITAGQNLQLQYLLGWACTRTQHYQPLASFSSQLAACQSPAEFQEIWQTIPLLEKETLRSRGKELMAQGLPPRQKPLYLSRTSGSTGIPVEVYKPCQTMKLWEALNLREQLWHKRDFSKAMCSIRHLKREIRKPEGNYYYRWANEYYQDGDSIKSANMHIGYPIETVAEWLANQNPSYLLTYPSLVEELFKQYEDPRKTLDHLEQILFISEPLDDDTRKIVEDQGIRTSDVYSSNETGQIAIECEKNRMHVQSEALLVEILDEQGHPCEPGQLGRVVITVLHNFAYPLIRYNIGDYASWGEPCQCGRTLPVINQVKGRVRNLLKTPEGKTWWPGALSKIRDITPVIQAQFVQVELDTIQLNLRLERALTPEEEEKARDITRKVLNYPFNVEINPVKEIGRSKSGKYEEFLSLVHG